MSDTSTSTNTFESAGELHGHNGPVYILCPCPENGLLASGGSDGVRLWDLQTLRQVKMPPQNLSFGPITAMVWAAREAEDMLFYGTGSGHVLSLAAERGSDFNTTWNWRIPEGGEVLSLASTSPSPTRMRLAASTRMKTVQMIEFTAETMQVIWSVQMRGTVPRAVTFAENGHDVQVFGMFDGTLYTIGGENGTTLTTHKPLAELIAYATVNSRRREVLIDTTDGFNLHNIDTGAFIRRYRAGDSVRRVPKQVAFGENGKIVVAGSDGGRVHVFDKVSGELLEDIIHSERGSVQTVATYEVGGVTTILCGSTSSDDTRITLWKKKARSTGSRSVKPARSSSPRNSKGAYERIVEFLSGILAILLVIGFLIYMAEKHSVDTSIPDLRDTVMSAVSQYWLQRVKPRAMRLAGYSRVGSREGMVYVRRKSPQWQEGRIMIAQQEPKKQGHPSRIPKEASPALETYKWPKGEEARAIVKDIIAL